MARRKTKIFKTIIVLLVLLIILLCVKLVIDIGVFKNKINLMVESGTITNDSIKEKVENNILDKKNKDMVKKQKVVKTVVSTGDEITVDYIGMFTNGEVFDTSIESVAKESGKYQTGRDYKNGLTFKAGAGQMISGFDKAVIGMKVGEKKTVTLEPKDAYGEWSEKNVQIVPFSQLPPKPDNSSYVEGDVLQSQYGPVTVVGVNDTGVKIDFNNPMAGKTLIFEITIRNIK